MSDNNDNTVTIGRAPLPPISHLLHNPTHHQSPPSTKPIQQQHPRSFSSQDALSSLPPLQGNDPPARRSHVYDTHYAVAPWRKMSFDQHPIIDPYRRHQEDEEQEEQQQQETSTYSNPPPQRHTRSLSMTSAPPASSWMADEATTMKHHRTEEKDMLVSRTQVVFDASGQPILKRKRGRPPSKHNTWQGGWVFLAPTVWTVQSCPQPPAPPPSSNMDPSSSSSTKSDMHDSMTAFTSSDLDMVLPMPRKKRGRKPKHNLAGHSCFVWRDIPTQQSIKKTTSL
ncbi:hypothetical protein O0I10_005021 [Lichtheimia ornata]|uniref:Uncharacterized protein n=1 Tax=Lichtheimia ornata TaxID=688661 RepID=A0AAD7V823_9FUNG|nr:uncharacterized protein O0I10_005021 [Lichtheimia ornata]KAJ8659306.1 hypothetical protein O0I10_005021 [Lichtheimia ornata]